MKKHKIRMSILKMLRDDNEEIFAILRMPKKSVSFPIATIYDIFVKEIEISSSMNGPVLVYIEGILENKINIS